MPLQASVVPIVELPDSTRAEMYGLMRRYYLNVAEDQFTDDLNRKTCAIILHEEGQLHGFSTWMLARYHFEGQSVNIIFSGDTIIEKDHWGSMALPLAWGRLMLQTCHQDSNTPVYWLLTSKGYKTYRYLPVFFKEFSPSPDQETPAHERRLASYLGALKYGDRFDAETSVIKAPDGAQCLRPGVADPDEPRLKDKFVAYFVHANPGAAAGDELLCLARCHPDNLKPFILRQLNR